MGQTLHDLSHNWHLHPDPNLVSLKLHPYLTLTPSLCKFLEGFSSPNPSWIFSNDVAKENRSKGLPKLDARHDATFATSKENQQAPSNCLSFPLIGTLEVG
jgi:hypothetical protein